MRDTDRPDRRPEIDQQLQRRRERQAAAKARFDPWQPHLGLAGWGIGVPAAERVRQAMWDVQDYRNATNTRGADGELACLAVRVAADTLANQIQAAAGPDHDDATVRWVLAGLRCPSRPFCGGCPAFQTVTAPGRPCKETSSPW